MDVDDSFQPEFSWRRAPVLLADRLGVRPIGLLGGLAAVLAAALGAWWAMRPPPPPAEEVLPFVQDLAPVAPATADVGRVEVVVVHVDGAVAHPGVHELRIGARITDAIDAAGGLLPGADRRAVNLAQRIGDGQRIWVPHVDDEDPVAVVSGGAAGEAGDAASGLVSLSTATPSMLEALPGIGPSLAAAIADHRDREGGFETVDDLLAVPGIGPAKLDGLRDLVVP
ncbi:MAG: helix-hairpin-helix domain-containing protein [Actinomycetota bacterium]